MRILGFDRYALSGCVAAAMLAACGGSQPPVGASGAMPQSPSITTHAQRGGSGSLVNQATAPHLKGFVVQNAMGAASSAKAADLLYVANAANVSIYSYPQGRLVGKLKGIASNSDCADTSGNVYITSGTQIYEYAHGGSKRIKTLVDLAGALGCSVDPTTGDLAVAGGSNKGSGPKGVAIFRNASGSPAYYKHPAFYEYWYCSYDSLGNLYVDGLSRPGTGNFVLGVLEKGAHKLRIVTLDQYIGWPGGVQWDGKYLAIGDQVTPAIYRFQIDGTTGKREQTVQLGVPANDVTQFVVHGTTLIAPNACKPSQCSWGSDVLLFRYPAGGTARKTVTKGVDGDHGVALSVAKAGR